MEKETANQKRDRRLAHERHGKLPDSSREIAIYAGELKLANGYERLIWGDHGPYFEIKEINLTGLKLKPNNYRGRYYDLYLAPNGAQIYHQRRTVKALPNPPHTGKYWADNNRLEGYADYRIGFYYCGILDEGIRTSQTPPEPQQLSLL
jgi:hypothetical protein